MGATSAYKVGDTFMSLPLPEAQGLLSNSTEKIEKEKQKLPIRPELLSKYGGTAEQVQLYSCTTIQQYSAELFWDRSCPYVHIRCASFCHVVQWNGRMEDSALC